VQADSIVGASAAKSAKRKDCRWFDKLIFDVDQCAEGYRISFSRKSEAADLNLLRSRQSGTNIGRRHTANKLATNLKQWRMAMRLFGSRSAKQKIASMRSKTIAAELCDRTAPRERNLVLLNASRIYQYTVAFKIGIQ
jgi:hypothetical protein